MLAAWAADLEARAAGESVWAVWRELIAGNDASPSAAFLARPEFAGSDALKALASEGPTPDRWSRFASALKGADVRLGPDTPQTRHLLVTTLVGNACGRRGGYGYYNEPAALLLGTLDGTMDCGVVKQGQRIDAVEGHGLFDEADAAAAWTAASVRCAAGEPVRLEFKGALVAETPCTKPLPAPPVAWRVLKTGLPDGA